MTKVFAAIAIAMGLAAFTAGAFALTAAPIKADAGYSAVITTTGAGTA